MDQASFRQWLDAYGDAWQTHDAEAIGKLFAEDALYYIRPFDAPLQGRIAIQDYWRGIAQKQSNVQFLAEILAINEAVCLAHWSTTFERAASAKSVRLDGILQATFADTMLCNEFREWWHSTVQ